MSPELPPDEPHSDRELLLLLYRDVQSIKTRLEGVCLPKRKHVWYVILAVFMLVAGGAITVDWSRVPQAATAARALAPP